jgi:Ni,Fe-hydrogenase III large subunit
MQVMADEAEESVRLIRELARSDERDRKGATGWEGSPEVQATAGRAGSALGWCESPRGESLVWLSFDGNGRVRRARLRPGTLRNWRAFDDAARSGNVFTDIPIIEASFWLTVAGFAR